MDEIKLMTTLNDEKARSINNGGGKKNIPTALNIKKTYE